MTAPEVVGRDVELEEVEAALGTEGRILLEGDAGIGKTTLWREAVRRASARGERVLAAQQVEAEAKLAFGALADLLQPVVEEMARCPRRSARRSASRSSSKRPPSRWSCARSRRV